MTAARLTPGTQRCAAALVLALAAGTATAQDRLRVVTTLSVLREVTAAVGGDRVAVEALAHPARDPHAVRPRPTLKRRVRRADAFVEIGLGLEPWAQQVIDASGNLRLQPGRPGRIIASRGIAVLEVDPDATRAQGHVHAAGNPHLWLDPIRLRQVAANVAAGLGALAPDDAPRFQRNLAAFQRRLDTALFGAAAVAATRPGELVAALQAGTLPALLKDKEVALGGWLDKAAPLRGRTFLTYHRNWSYLAERFGLRVPMTVEKHPGITPSARHRDATVRAARDQDVRAVVSAAYYAARASDWVAEKAAVRHLRLPMDVGADPRAGDYFALIDLILDALLDTVPS